MNKFIVSKNNEGLRIDSFILKINRDISRSLIYKMLRKRKVLINKKRTTNPKTVLKEGDEVFLNFFIEVKKEEEKKIVKIELKDEVVYEDEKIIVLNKPNGFSMHSGKKNYNTRVFQYLESHGTKVKDQAFQIHHVHRLDKNTKGLVVYAKDRETYQYLDKQFKNREVSKEYIALIKDIDDNLKKRLYLEEKFIFKDGKPYISRDANVGKDAKILIEHLDTLDEFKLVRIKSITGRKHQIRLLCSHHGMPIVNDPIYGVRITSNNMMLFSKKIEFKKFENSPLKKYSFDLDMEWVRGYIENELF